MQKVNSIYFYPSVYDMNEYSMWDDVAATLQALTKNGYIAVVKEEDSGLVLVEFETGDREIGDPYPFWLSPEEADRVVFNEDVEDGDI